MLEGKCRRLKHAFRLHSCKLAAVILPKQFLPISSEAHRHACTRWLLLAHRYKQQTYDLAMKLKGQEAKMVEVGGFRTWEDEFLGFKNCHFFIRWEKVRIRRMGLI